MIYYEKQLIRLLLIASDKGTAGQFQTYLQGAELNIKLEIAHSGAAGVAAYDPNEFDCILLDHDLNDMNAQMVLTLIQDGPTLWTPTIVIASIEVHNLDLEILEFGAVEFLNKKICNALLLKRVILYALVRAQYVKSQRDYLSSHKQLAEHPLFYEDKSVVERLKAEKIKAERENKAKSEFLSIASHELRTPLTSIKGSLSLLNNSSSLSLYQILIRFPFLKTAMLNISFS